MSRLKRWALGLVITLLVFAGLATSGLYFGSRTLKSQVEAALGPESEIGAIQLHWDRVEVSQLRLKAPAGWPAPDTLRAERIIIVPDLRGLLDARIRIARIRIEGGYVSALRTPDGKLRVVPSLLERPPSPPEEKKAPPMVQIGRIELADGVMEFFDATVKKPALKIRLEQLNATVDNILVPDLTGHTALALDGLLKGARSDGRNDGHFALKGWAEVASKDSDITTTLRGVDLIALQPYLIKAAETGVKRGTLDLDLHSTVRDNRLKAPGTLILKDLELDSGSSTFMGMPRQAVVGLMKDKKGLIEVKFALEGNLKDPQFKLNENLASRIGTSVADSLGVSFEGLARGAGSVGQKTMEVAGSAASGVGKAIKGLFGN